MSPEVRGNWLVGRSAGRRLPFAKRRAGDRCDPPPGSPHPVTIRGCRLASSAGRELEPRAVTSGRNDPRTEETLSLWASTDPGAGLSGPKNWGASVAWRRDVLLPPLPQPGESRRKRFTRLGQQVFVSRRMLAVSPSTDYARLLELLQTDRERFARRTRVAKDVVEAVHAKTELAEDQQRVALAYNGQSVGDRANSRSIGAQAGAQICC